MRKQPQLVADGDTLEAIREVNDGSAVVDPIPSLSMPPLETVAQDIDSRAPLADKKMFISKTQYSSLNQMREDVNRISRNLTDPSIIKISRSWWSR